MSGRGNRPCGPLHDALVLSFMLAALSSLVEASQVRPVNLEEMSRRAERIFSGRCIEVRSGRDPSLGIEVTILKLKVERVAKGRLGRTVTLRLPGSVAGDGEPAGSIVGSPAFRQGDEVVLFLYGESRAGLTSPIGLGQGKFTVMKDKQGRRIAMNGIGNRHLLRGLSADGERKLGGRSRATGAEQDLTPETLLDFAEALAK